VKPAFAPSVAHAPAAPGPRAPSPTRDGCRGFPKVLAEIALLKPVRTCSERAEASEPLLRTERRHREEPPGQAAALLAAVAGPPVAPSIAAQRLMANSADLVLRLRAPGDVPSITAELLLARPPPRTGSGQPLQPPTALRREASAPAMYQEPPPTHCAGPERAEALGAETSPSELARAQAADVTPARARLGTQARLAAGGATPEVREGRSFSIPEPLPLMPEPPRVAPAPTPGALTRPASVPAAAAAPHRPEPPGAPRPEAPTPSPGVSIAPADVAPPPASGRPRAREAETAPLRALAARSTESVETAREPLLSSPPLLAPDRPADPVTAPPPARQLAEALAARLPEAPVRFEVVLEPERLGKVEVRLEVRGEAVQLSLIAQSSEARDQLQHGLGELRAALAERGLTLGEAQISTRDDRDRREAFASRERGDLAATVEETPEEVPWTRMAHRSGLDIRI
jgi:flagellar hook-length control protein FliK